MILILTTLLLLAPADDIKLSKDETGMIESINEYRAKYKLPVLEMDPTLMKVARCPSASLHAQLPRTLDLG